MDAVVMDAVKDEVLHEVGGGSSATSYWLSRAWPSLGTFKVQPLSLLLVVLCLRETKELQILNNVLTFVGVHKD